MGFEGVIPLNLPDCTPGPFWESRLIALNQSRHDSLGKRKTIMNSPGNIPRPCRRPNLTAVPVHNQTQMLTVVSPWVSRPARSLASHPGPPPCCRPDFYNRPVSWVNCGPAPICRSFTPKHGFKTRRRPNNKGVDNENNKTPGGPAGHGPGGRMLKRSRRNRQR